MIARASCGFSVTSPPVTQNVAVTSNSSKIASTSPVKPAVGPSSNVNATIGLSILAGTGATVLVTANALRLLAYKPSK